MSSLKNVTKNTFLYTISQVLQRASSIIFFPIFSYYLTKGDYGIQGVTAYINQFFILFCGLELARVATRLIHDGDKEERIRKIYGTFILAIFSISTLAVLFFYFTGPYLLKSVLNDIPFNPYVTYILISLPFVLCYNLFRNYLQATNQGMLFIKVDIFYFLSNIFFNLLFVIQYKMGAAGLMLSTIVSSIIFSFYAYFKFYRKTILRIDIDILVEGLKFSIPLIPYILLGALLEGTDKIILNSKLGKDVGGVFYISTMIATLFNVFRESSNSAITPWYYENFEKLSNSYINKVIYSIFAGMAIVAIGISWFSYEILFILSSNKELIEAYKYTPIIINTALIVFLSQIYTMMVMHKRTNTRFLFLSSLLGWPTSVGLCYILIDYYGPMGAAMSNMGAMIVLTLVCGFLTDRSGIKINHLYFVSILIISLAISLLGLIPLQFWMMIILKVVCSSFILFVYYLYLNNNFNIKDLLIEKTRPIINFIAKSSSK